MNPLDWASLHPYGAALVVSVAGAVFLAASAVAHVIETWRDRRDEFERMRDR